MKETIRNVSWTSYQTLNESDEEDDDQYMRPLIKKQTTTQHQDSSFFPFSSMLALNGLAVIIAVIVTITAVAYLQTSGNVVKDNLVLDLYEGAKINSNWAMNKYTIAAATDKITLVGEFVDKHIAAWSGRNEYFGCDETRKTIAYISIGSSDSANNNELHFVDTSVYPDVTRTVGDWSDYVESLGMADFNVFMHNKMQMYVPDLSGHYAAIVESGEVSSLLRLSSSIEGTNDVAHIVVHIPHTLVYYEIVGPASSLTSDQMASFQTWADHECPQSHRLEYGLSYYAAMYANTYIDDTRSSWMTSTGMYTPMAILVQVPASSVEELSNTFVVYESLMQLSPRYSQDGTCEMYTFFIADDNSYDDVSASMVASVRYVINPEAGSGPLYSLSDWEDDVKSAHATYLTSDGGSWDRYLDQHIGFQQMARAETLSDADCEDWLKNAEDTISEDNMMMASRSSNNGTGSLRYYVGVSSVMAIQLTTSCGGAYRDFVGICGCNPQNNDKLFEELTGQPCMRPISAVEFV